jgi:hypothetical protein
MSNTRNFAERELDILVKSNSDPDNRPIIEEFIPEILALVDKFGNSGQSGGSAPFTAGALSSTIKKLCMQEPICPITGIDDEWEDISAHNDGEPMWQNKRCSAIFRDGDDNAYYVDAVVKKTQNNSCWSGSFWLNLKDYLTGNRELMISNCQFIRGFPFTPKTFYIDVIEEEIAKDDWEMFLKDPKQLEEVFQYYKPTPVTRKVLVEKINNSLL